MKEFSKVIQELHELITTLYGDFPVYKDLDLAAFASMFDSYRSILNLDMVKMGYFKGQAVGFFVSVPNYGNKVYQLNSLKNILQILRLRKHPKEYVMTYMGVLPEHKGLGSALVQSIILELKKNGLPSIGALARDGKVTQVYADDLIEERYEYVFLGKRIGEKGK